MSKLRPELWTLTSGHEVRLVDIRKVYDQWHSVLARFTVKNALGTERPNSPVTYDVRYSFEIAGSAFAVLTRMLPTLALRDFARLSAILHDRYLFQTGPFMEAYEQGTPLEWLMEFYPPIELDTEEYV